MTGDHDCAHIILLRTNMNRTILLRALVQFLRWRYYRDTERYYGLLSIPEQIWELERRKQMLVRSMTLWCVACGAGLILARSLFVLPPVTPAQQNVYGIAVILLLTGIGIFSDSVRVQRWKQMLSKREQNASAREMREKYV